MTHLVQQLDAETTTHSETASARSKRLEPKERWLPPSAARPVARPLQMRRDAGITGEAVMDHREGLLGNGGLPVQLKRGVEQLSGMSMADVTVHYNSDKPRSMGAHAYAQGSAIHLAPGQEHHLPHEAWHVVQQKQGRVVATSQVGHGEPLNDDPALEREADIMGARALATTPNTATADAMPKRTASAPHHGPVQRAYAQEQYTGNQQQRTLSIDPQSVTWGGAPQNQRAQQDRNGQRAIMYETISTPGRVNGLIQSYQGLAVNAMWDVGLSLVLNSFYVPTQNNVYSLNGNNLNQNHAVPQNQQRAQVEQTLNQARQQLVQNWQGPPIVVATAAWERHFVQQAPQNIVLEPAKANVPYARLRRWAGSNPQASTVRNALEQRQNATVWRKMGDDDMPMVDPNDGNNAQIDKLSDIEDEVDGVSTFVSFGYELTDNNVGNVVPGLIQKVYAKEMELRDAIAELGAKTYPIEPNTYYKFSGDQVGNQAFANMENVNVGGGGQIKEGLRLMSATQDVDYTEQRQFHRTRVATDSGGRNQALIQMLQGSIQQAQNRQEPDIWAGGVINILKNMDQSYFQDGVWVTVATELSDAQAVAAYREEGNALVEKMRREVAVEITSAIYDIWRSSSRGW